MKTCEGCKNLGVRGGRGWCKEVFGDVQAVVDPTINRVRYMRPYKYGMAFLDNTSEACRAPGMPCGPERRLYAPTLWRRIIWAIIAG